MPKKDEIYELIRAMSPNEKRFFRLSSVQPGKETNYLRVFTAMDNLPEFDTARLKRKLGNKKINLSYEKNYLHRQILRSLRHFYSGGNSAIELQDILKTLEILYRKRLNTQCQKMISRGIAICREFEQWHYHLELIDWQYRLYARTGNYKAIGQYSVAGLREKEMLLQEIARYSQRQEEVYFIVSVLQQKGAFMNDEDRKRFKRLGRSYANREKNTRGFRTTEMTYTIQYMLHHYLNNFKQAYLWSKATYELYRAHPQYERDQPFRCYAAKNNLVTRCMVLGRYDEALQLVNELETFVGKLSPISLQEIREEHSLNILIWKTKFLFNLDRCEEALEVAQAFERKGALKHLRPLLRLTADSFLARIYFYNRRYKESLRIVNRQLRDGLSILQPDYLLFAWLLRTCIYWELQNHELIEPQSNALKHFMKKNKITDDFATGLIDRLRNHAHGSGAKEQKQFWAATGKILAPLITKDTEQYEVILSWVQQKSR